MTTQTLNTDIINEYREHQKKAEQLATAARSAMQSRFTAILAEAAQLAMDYEDAFKAKLDLPPGIRFTLIDAKPEPAKQMTDAQSKGKKIGGLRRSLNAAIKHGEAAKVTEIRAQLKDLGAEVDDPPAAVPSTTNEPPADDVLAALNGVTA